MFRQTKRIRENKLTCFAKISHACKPQFCEINTIASVLFSDINEIVLYSRIERPRFFRASHFRAREREAKKGTGSRRKTSEKSESPSAKEKAQIRALSSLSRTTLETQIQSPSHSAGGKARALSKVFACPCCMSLLPLHAACSCCMSVLLPHSEFLCSIPYFIPMLRLHAACACCRSLLHAPCMFLHVYAVCPCMSMLHVLAASLFCMSMLHVSPSA